MQIKKENIKEKILISAKNEFLDKGYTNASLRVISEKAGLTKGALYSYFKNKDALFCELTKVAVDFIEAEFSESSHYIKSSKEYCNDFPLEDKIKSYRLHANTVLDNYDNYKLLLFCAAGSSLESYKEKIIQMYASQFILRSTFMEKKVNFSELYVHTLASTYVSYLEEIVLHKPNRDEVEMYATQMAIFVDAGMRKLSNYLSS